jgi:hypothetical protein
MARSAPTTPLPAPAPQLPSAPSTGTTAASGSGITLREALALTFGLGDRTQQRVGQRMRAEGFVPDLPIVFVPGFSSAVLRIEHSDPVPRWKGRRAWLSLRRLGYRTTPSPLALRAHPSGPLRPSAVPVRPDDSSSVYDDGGEERAETASVESDTSSISLRDATTGHGAPAPRPPTHLLTHIHTYTLALSLSLCV